MDIERVMTGSGLVLIKLMLLPDLALGHFFYHATHG